MEDCLVEIGGSAYNVTNWLLYDLDFNVSNLILAAVKHNRDAPILLMHWYPQLVRTSATSMLVTATLISIGMMLKMPI